MIVDDHELAAKITESTRLYQCVYDQLQAIMREIANDSPIELQSRVESLVELQGRAMEADEALKSGLNGEETLGEDVHDMLAKRRDIVQEILKINDALKKQARSVQSLLSHELEGLRQGHAAMAGYKSGQASGGRIVNSAT